MEDLIAIQSKSIAELREIAKVLGITDEKLSKKEKKKTTCRIKR